MRHSLDTSATTRSHTLGERLRSTRYARNLTQQELAGATFSKSYISAIERGKMMPSLPALRLLAQRLDVSLAFLLGEQELPLHGSEKLLEQRLDEAEVLLHRAKPVSALERLGSDEAAIEIRQQNQARWDWLRGWALLQLHQEEEAIALLEQGLQDAAARQARCALGHFAFTLGTVQAAQKQEEAEQRFQTALRCAEQTDDQFLLSNVQEHYAALLAAQGRFQDAYDLLRAPLAAMNRATIHYSTNGEAGNN